nr:MAG: hypothetical protein [Bacteriophage sp.]
MTHDKYDTDILKTLKSIDASLKNIAKSVQPVNTTVIIDNNPSRNECGEIDECIGCNIEDCYDIHGDGTNKKCKWKNLIDKEAEEMKDDN